MATGMDSGRTRAGRAIAGAGPVVHAPGGARTRLATRAAADRLQALLCALLALAVRVLYLLESTDNPFRHHLDLDPRNYHAWATAILGGQGLGAGPFQQAPLYPYFLAGCYAVLGADPARVLWVQALLGAAATYLAARVASRYWGRVGLIATGLAMALFAPAVFYTGVLLVPALATFLLALAFWLAPRRVFWAGLVAGLAGLAHPTILPGALIVIAGMVLHERGGPVRAHARAALLLAAGALAGILPATIHNLAVSGRPVLISVNSGINLYIGNGPLANGFYMSPFGMRGEEDPLGIREAGRLAGRPLSPLQANQYWSREARAQMRRAPGRALALLARKAHFALAAYEAPQIESFDFEKRFSLLLRLPFLPGWLALLALLAAALALRPREVLPWALAAGVLADTAVLAVYFVTARFRMPTHVLLALGTGAAVSAIAERVRAAMLWQEAGNRDGGGSSRGGLARGLWPAGAACAGVLLAFGPNWLSVGREQTFGQYYYRLGILAEREGRTEDATAAYEEALRIDPGVARASINLGILTARRGDLDRARGLLERGLARDPRSARGHLALGQIHQVRGELALACSLYSAAWAADSSFVPALEYLGTCEYLLGNLADAEEHCREVVQRLGRDATQATRCAFTLQRLAERRQWGLPLPGSRERREADLALAVRNRPAAEASYRSALARDPGDLVALIELARLARLQGGGEPLEAWRERFRAAGGRAEVFEALIVQ